MKPLLLAVAAAGVALTAAACGTSSPGAAPASTVTVTETAPPASASSPVVTPSAPTTTGPVGQATAECATGYLNATVGPEQGAAGSEYVSLIFTNLNDVPCTMYGYPGVALAAGSPLSDVGQPSAENPSPPRELVTLAPGGEAYATLQIADAGNFPASECGPVTSISLAVIPPNQTAPLHIPFSSTACQGPEKLLTVTAVRPGTGS